MSVVLLFLVFLVAFSAGATFGFGFSALFDAVRMYKYNQQIEWLTRGPYYNLKMFVGSVIFSLFFIAIGIGLLMSIWPQV